MSEQVYKEMVAVMTQRSMAVGGIFGGKDIPEFYRMVEALFTPEEAEINNAMPSTTFSAEQLAEIMGQQDGLELGKTLEQMANKGLCVSYLKGDLRLFRAAPFIPGILEFVFKPGGITKRDKELAKVIHEYERAWEADEEFVLPYPIQRVITVDESIESGHKIHTYDQVRTYIDANEDIAAAACYCRHAAFLRGEDIHGMPTQVCLAFGKTAQYTTESLGARKLTRDEAYKMLDECREAGLVHMTHNTADEVSYLCNCDKYHCNTITGILKYPKPSEFLNSGFEPKFDADCCTGCEICLDRCPANALVMGNQDVPDVDLNLCFGCAVCATGCDDEAVTMVAKTIGYVPPPRNNKELMQKMLAASSK